MHGHECQRKQNLHHSLQYEGVQYRCEAHRIGSDLRPELSRPLALPAKLLILLIHHTRVPYVEQYAVHLTLPTLQATW